MGTKNIKPLTYCFCKSIKENHKLEINRQSKKTWRLSHYSPTPFISSGWIPGCWSWTPAEKHKWFSVLLGHISVLYQNVLVHILINRSDIYYALSVILFITLKMQLIILTKLLAHIFSVLKSNSLLFLFYILFCLWE